ncbi:MAG: hypothetical protein K9L68_07905 [Spirochaetales bacterium]|nr:hypothetical protein [Spirochaetales bacterium]MCF7938506.1 hypothetical protein [Spirochaetales bacterium]
MKEFINAAMIGETYFFREVSQFRILLEYVLNEISRKNDNIRIWSASCSTGEEAISLSAAALYNNKNTADTSVEIFASDINTLALERIQSGTYPKSSLRRDGKELHHLITDHIEKENGSSFTLNNKILSSISVVPLNLYKDPLTQIPDDLDVIFFRNTLIYAPMENRKYFIRKIAEKLRAGGYLFVAASEVPYITVPQLEPVEFKDVHLFRRITQQQAETETPSPTAEKPDTKERKDEVPPLKEYIQKTVNAFNRENMKEAEIHLMEIENTYGDTVYTFFLKGLYFRDIGSKEEAMEKLSAALSWNSFFWPASYYLAELYTETDPLLACSEFRRCLIKIESQQHHETADKEIEDILLDGFDKSYFHHLCNRWINKLCTYAGEEYAH